VKQAHGVCDVSVSVKGSTREGEGGAALACDVKQAHGVCWV
jgi:hypothetical protein